MWPDWVIPYPPLSASFTYTSPPKLASPWFALHRGKLALVPGPLHLFLLPPGPSTHPDSQHSASQFPWPFLGSRPLTILFEMLPHPAHICCHHWLTHQPPFFLYSNYFSAQSMCSHSKIYVPKSRNFVIFTHLPQCLE